MFTATLLTLGLASLLHGATPPSNCDRHSAAIAFLDDYRFERDIDREYALYNLSPIQNLRLLSRHANLEFYYFPTAASSLTGHVAIAVLDRTAAIEITSIESMNLLTDRLNLVIENPDQAESLVRDYLQLHYIHASVWYGVEGGLNLLDSADDIVFDPSSIDHEVERATVEHLYEIIAPTVHKAADGFIFEGFSWQPYSGLIRRHTFTISGKGAISQDEIELARGFGDLIRGCIIPYDRGPKLGELRALATHQNDEVRIVVPTYVQRLEAATNSPHEYFFEQHRDSLVELLETLLSDESPEVREAALDALDVLTSL